MYKIMKAINNFFTYKMESGSYAISGSDIEGKFGNVYLTGMYIVIQDSYLNDGLYKISSASSTKITVEETLITEDTSETMIIANCKIPEDFITLSTEISTYISGSTTGIKSKQLGKLSITYNGDSSWESVYSNELSSYRRMYNDFETSPARNRYLGGCY